MCAGVSLKTRSSPDVIRIRFSRSNSFPSCFSRYVNRPATSGTSRLVIVASKLKEGKPVKTVPDVVGPVSARWSGGWLASIGTRYRRSRIGPCGDA
jgi:hypothetical protein